MLSIHVWQVPHTACLSDCSQLNSDVPQCIWGSDHLGFWASGVQMARQEVGYAGIDWYGGPGGEIVGTESTSLDLIVCTGPVRSCTVLLCIAKNRFTSAHLHYAEQWLDPLVCCHFILLRLVSIGIVGRLRCQMLCNSFADSRVYPCRFLWLSCAVWLDIFFLILCD